MASNRERTPTARHYLGLAVALLVLTAYGSVIPLRYQPKSWDQAVERFAGISYADPSLVHARGDWIVNTVQYAMLAFCAMGAIGVDRGRRFGLLAALVVAPAGALVALGLEFAQVFFPPRTVSINDLFVECVGIALGLAAWLMVGQGLTDWLRRFWSRKGVAGLATQLLPAYLLVLLAAQLMPFDVVLDRAELARKLTEGRIRLLPAGGFRNGIAQLGHFAAFSVVGGLFAVMPRWSGMGWKRVLAFGLGLAVVLEVLQLFVFTRFSVASDLVLEPLAVLFGWWAVGVLREAWVSGRYGLGTLRARWLGGVGMLGERGGVLGWLAFAAWVALVVVINWYPFRFTLDQGSFQGADGFLTDENTRLIGLRRLAWAPLVDYYWGSRYNALDQFLTRSISFLPLGVLTALRFARRERRGLVVTLALAAWIGTLIEVGQYFLPERHPGTTDLLIEVLGAWLGFALTRHVMRALGPEHDTEARGEARYSYAHFQSQPTGTAAGASTMRRPSSGKAGRPAGTLLLPDLPSASRLLGRLGAWLDAQPRGIRVVLIGTVAVFLAVALTRLASVLVAF